MDDRTLFHHVNDLAAEEEELWHQAGEHGGLNAEQEARLEAIKVELDQAYDLLHQREARRAAGLDPDEAAIRPPEVVERYQQ